MPGQPGRSGGARRGSGPVRRRFTLSLAAATLLREYTRSRLSRRDVSEQELTTELETIITAAVEMRLRELSIISE